MASDQQENKMNWFQSFVAYLSRSNQRAKPWKIFDMGYANPRTISDIPFKDFFNDDVSEIKAIKICAEGHGNITVRVGDYTFTTPLVQNNWIEVQVNVKLAVPLSNFNAVYSISMAPELEGSKIQYGMAKLQRIIICYR